MEAIAKLKSVLLARQHDTALSVITSAKGVIQGMRLDDLEQRDLLLQLLNHVANGEDGIAGTDDDLISPEIMVKLRYLLENNMIHDMADMIKIPRGCFPCFGK
jgi:hypothetical protein